MVRYKERDYRQDKFLPISFDKQILPGTLSTLSSTCDTHLHLTTVTEFVSTLSMPKQ
jgi:hypothetical protein